MKIFYDEKKDSPDGWIGIKNPKDVINNLKRGLVKYLSIGDDDEKSSDFILLWIEEAIINFGFKPPFIKTHSISSPTRKKIENAIRSIKKYSLL